MLLAAAERAECRYRPTALKRLALLEPVETPRRCSCEEALRAASTKMSAQKYKVVVGKETFWLSQSQILNAPDSFFSCLVNGDWTESLTCQLEVDRSPELFRIM
jgi:hypothetical protein